jgi:hypothetical protein
MVGAGSKVCRCAADRGVPTGMKQPIDAGPTAQRYAEREARVKLGSTACRRCRTGHRDTREEPSTSDTPTGLETCGQVVDPQVRTLLGFPPPSCRSRATLVVLIP